MADKGNIGKAEVGDVKDKGQGVAGKANVQRDNEARERDNVFDRDVNKIDVNRQQDQNVQGRRDRDWDRDRDFDRDRDLDRDIRRDKDRDSDRDRDWDNRRDRDWDRDRDVARRQQYGPIMDPYMNYRGHGGSRFGRGQEYRKDFDRDFQDRFRADYREIGVGQDDDYFRGRNRDQDDFRDSNVDRDRYRNRQFDRDSDVDFNRREFKDRDRRDDFDRDFRDSDLERDRDFRRGSDRNIDYDRDRRRDFEDRDYDRDRRRDFGDRDRDFDRFRDDDRYRDYDRFRDADRFRDYDRFRDEFRVRDYPGGLYGNQMSYGQQGAFYPSALQRAQGPQGPIHHPAQIQGLHGTQGQIGQIGQLPHQVPFHAVQQGGIQNPAQLYHVAAQHAQIHRQIGIPFQAGVLGREQQGQIGQLASQVGRLHHPGMIYHGAAGVPQGPFQARPNIAGQSNIAFNRDARAGGFGDRMRMDRRDERRDDRREDRRDDRREDRRDDRDRDVRDRNINVRDNVGNKENRDIRDQNIAGKIDQNKNEANDASKKQGVADDQGQRKTDDKASDNALKL
jgi:hypothetical protein